MALYFAYGSNMCLRQMSARCPQSRCMGPARLLSYRWIIAADGFASVVSSRRDTVMGTLYDVSSSDEYALDCYEEISTGAYRKCYLPVEYEGKTVDALVYINNVSEEGLAGSEYGRLILEGIGDAALSDAYVSRYIRRYLSVQAPDASGQQDHT